MIFKEIFVLRHVHLENGNIAEWSTVIIAFIALIYTIKEYNNHLKRERANVLSQFNQRFSSDENIKNVVEEIFARAFPDECTKRIIQVTTHEKEMFMRFFEELQYAIIADNLDKKEVRYMFGYYALLASEIHKRDGYLYKKKDEHNWKKFQDFVVQMDQIQPLTTEDKGLFA